MTSFLSAASLALALFAATGPLSATRAAAQGGAEPVTVNLKAADGADRGTVTFTGTPNGVLVSADLKNLPDGTYGFHLHEKGLCEGAFESAGGHDNPTGKEHGFLSANGPHAGDMPNVTVIGGVAKVTHYNAMVRMSGGEAPLNDADGTSIMLHDGADDYAGQPSGHAGGRLACGVVFAAP